MKSLSGLPGMVIFLAIVGVVAAILFFYGRGFRPDFNNGDLKSTGVLTIKSLPNNAQVFVNDTNKGVTNLDIANLSPGTYKVRITKDGFSTWEREVEIKKEQVNEIAVVLFPLAPNLRSLTFTGIEKVLATPNMQRLIFTVSQKGNEGIWYLNLADPAIPLFSSQQLVKIISDTDQTSYSQGLLQISPDGNHLLVTTGAKENPIYYLLDVQEEKGGNQPRRLLDQEAATLTKSWSEQLSKNKLSKIKSLGEKAGSAAKNLTEINFSPDDKRFFGKDKDGKILLYDSRPSPDPGIKESIYSLRAAKSFNWYSDSKHLVVVEDHTISVMDVDGTNKISIFSGDFDPNLTIPWPDGSRIVIKINLNSASSKLPNLYSIELR